MIKRWKKEELFDDQQYRRLEDKKKKNIY